MLDSAALLAFGMSAQAADLPTRMATNAPVVAAPAPYNWNGFYIGGNVGWGWADHSSDSFTDAGVFVTSTSARRDGFLGGGQVGYNWMAWPNIVLGVEADVAGADIKDTSTSTTATGTSQTDAKNDWFGTARVRAGYASNNWLLYGPADLPGCMTLRPERFSLASSLRWSGNPLRIRPH